MLGRASGDGVYGPDVMSCITEPFPRLYVRIFPRGKVMEFFVTATASGFDAAMEVIHREQATILEQHVFAPVGGRHFQNTARGDVNWPVTWVDSGGGRGSSLAGTHIHAVKGVRVNRIEIGGRVVGSWFEDDEARYCRLGGILPPDTSAPRPEQARQVFSAMEVALRAAQMNPTCVVRTGIYLNKILEWYGVFNQVRTAIYRENGLLAGLVPASTGISGGNPAGAAIMMDALAVVPKTADFRTFAVMSPLQCSPSDYGSSFSRAVELASSFCRRLLISGAASIEPSGRSAHVGDMDAQVELTMRVVSAILESRRMTWADTVRCIAYIKQSQYTPAFEQYCRTAGLSGLPVILTENDICRDELLFEIQVDAMSKHQT